MNVVNRAIQLRSQVELMAEGLDDEDALEVVELFPNWSEGKAYAVSDRVRYNDVLYKCLQAHTSQSDWIPADAVSLWARVLIPDPEVIPDWVQPDSTNPYMMGDKVRHLDKVWVSTIDNNVWEPSVYGWDEVV